MPNKIYINDFCEDLNYQGIILYIGLVNSKKLLEALERDNVSHCYRFYFAASNDDRNHYILDELTKQAIVILNESLIKYTGRFK